MLRSGTLHFLQATTAAVLSYPDNNEVLQRGMTRLLDNLDKKLVVSGIDNNFVSLGNTPFVMLFAVFHTKAAALGMLKTHEMVLQKSRVSSRATLDINTLQYI